MFNVWLVSVFLSLSTRDSHSYNDGATEQNQSSFQPIRHTGGGGGGGLFPHGTLRVEVWGLNIHDPKYVLSSFEKKTHTALRTDNQSVNMRREQPIFTVSQQMNDPSSGGACRPFVPPPPPSPATSALSTRKTSSERSNWCCPFSILFARKKQQRV